MHCSGGDCSGVLQEIFVDWDRNCSGGITLDQLKEIFRIYKVGIIDSKPYIAKQNKIIFL